ncbi:hypothetical protein B4U80_02843 [Leptotrombidium deliense]|uniref:BLOC-1-related complex subunit 6 C-terminal helix domain-containing protein n=1 Tax=Leptotrombidium deliense TaxID=299467 RepID=A0A443SKA5_9ACAR|nr:hypothetical protein B4U80_02843 [Leptotrombidium deliense]
MTASSSREAISECPTSSSDTGGNCDAIARDMMTSSYTEISFGDSDCDDQTDVEEMGLFNDIGDERSPVDPNDPKALQMSRGSLSLPQLSSKIVDWSEKAKAEYDAAFNADKRSNRSITAEPAGSIEYTEDGMVTYVAEDLETQLRLSSPNSSRSYSVTSDENLKIVENVTVDPLFLNELEKRTKQISNNLNAMVQHISNYTHNVTSMTVNCVREYEKCLMNTCDDIDASIKLMYQLIAKCEELNEAMSPIDALNTEIKEVKRLLDLFERAMETKTFP